MAVKDNFNVYYTQLLEELQDEYSKLRGGTVFKDEPPSFPYMYFRQIDGATSAMTLSMTEDAVRLSVQIDIFSDESAAEARNISKQAREIMFGLEFRCSYFAPIQNEGDPSIYRFSSRYEKIDT